MCEKSVKKKSNNKKKKKNQRKHSGNVIQQDGMFYKSQNRIASQMDQVTVSEREDSLVHNRVVHNPNTLCAAFCLGSDKFSSSTDIEQ